MARPIKHFGKWRIRWVDHEGNRRSETYESKREAELNLSEHLRSAYEIKHHGKLPIIEGKTFANLCVYWCENRAGNAKMKRSYKSDQSIIQVHLGPFFGEKLLKRIAVEHIDQYKCKKANEVSEKTLYNHITLLSSMMNLAKDMRWIETGPKIRRPKISLDNCDFSYLRTDDEISKLLRAAIVEGPKIYNFYLTAIYTGMRAGELAALRWSDVDLNTRLITVQRSFDGPTKSGKIRHIPILDELLSILRQWKLSCPGIYVFPNESDRMHQPSDRIFQEILHRILKRAAFPDPSNSKRKRYIVFHSLRHTFASHWVMKGGDIFKLQKILGHQSIQMTMRYAHLAPTAYASDLSRFSRLNLGQPALIIPLSK